MRTINLGGEQMQVLFLRRGFGLSQEEVAKELDMSRVTLRRKENGETDFTKTEMVKLTEMFKKHNSKLTVEDIFFT